MSPPLPPPAITPLAGLIACGGASSRMGSPKASLTWHGEAFLSRIASRLSTVARPVVVVAAPHQELPPLPPATLRIDDDLRSQGPLAALSRGLRELEGIARATYFCGCDAPLLVPEFVTHLAGMLDDDCDLVVVRWNGKLQGCASLVRVTLRPVVEQLLDAGHRRLLDLSDYSRCRVVDASELATVDPHCLTLRGVNTPTERAALERDWGWVQ